MDPSSLDQAAASVLRGYAAPRAGCRLVALGNAGGFSGARLWRVETAAGALCLRAWPPGDPPPERLREVHGWMRAATDAGLAFVPTILQTDAGATWTEYIGRLWELTHWQHGRADFRERPTAARIEAACTALARLHAVWAGLAPATGPCPAVRRRLERFREWTAFAASGWRPHRSAGAAGPLRQWAERAWTALSSQVATIPALLHPWSTRQVPLQPCLGDVWHDHILFEGDAVTGLIDYGAARVDHVAVDLARLLGSLAGDDARLRTAGLAAYTRLRPLSCEEEALVTVLDRTGTLLGAANWLLWLYRDGRTFEDQEGVVRRLAALVERLERI